LNIVVRNVHVLILSEGVTSRDIVRDRENRKDKLSNLAQASQISASILGVDSIKLLDFPDNRMDSIDRLEVTKIIEDQIDRIKPDMVVTHHAGDVNIDHQITHHAVVTACRPQPGSTVRRLLVFETMSSTEWQPPESLSMFHPNWFEDISSTLDCKLEALKAYASEMRPFPHSRSYEAVEYLAHWRGATVGVESAEAFMLLRGIY